MALWRADIAFGRGAGGRSPVKLGVCFFSKERESFFIRRAKSHSVKRVAWRWCGVHFFPGTKGRIGSVALLETDPLGPTGTRVLIKYA